MIVTCERCSARYKLDDAKIRGRGARITCPKCRYVFVVYRDGADEADTPSSPPPPEADAAPSPGHGAPAEPAAAEPPARAPARSAESLDFRRVGIPTWKVKVRIGLVYDFSDIRTLRKYIQDKRVTVDDVISYDGTEWTRIGDIPDLDAFFVRIYEEREGRIPDRPPAAEDDEFEDGPTMIVDVGALGQNISTGVFARPTPDGAPPEPRETPLRGTPESPRFQDPFDALKDRQRDRSRARSGARNGTRPAQGRNGKSGRNAPAGSPLRKPLPLLAAAALVVGFSWLAFCREPESSAPAGASAATPEPPRGQVGLNPDQIRENVRGEIEKRFAALGDSPPLPEPDPIQEDASLPRPVVPADAARVVAPPPLTVEATPRTLPPPGSGARGGTGTSGGTTGAGTAEVVKTATTAQDHAAAGDALAAAGDWAGAATAFGNAVQMDGSNARFRYRYGEALYRTGRVDDAQAQFRTAASSVPAANKYLGHILRDLGDASGAVYHYREYLKSGPADASTIEEELRRLTGQ